MLDNELINNIKEKKDKNEAEIALLKYYECFREINKIMVAESKGNYSCEGALNDVRNALDEYLW